MPETARLVQRLLFDDAAPARHDLPLRPELGEDTAAPRTRPDRGEAARDSMHVPHGPDTSGTTADPLHISHPLREIARRLAAEDTGERPLASCRTPRFHPDEESKAVRTLLLEHGGIIFNERGGLRAYRDRRDDARRDEALNQLCRLFERSPQGVLQFIFRELPREQYEHHRRDADCLSSRAVALKAVSHWIESSRQAQRQVADWVRRVLEEVSQARKSAERNGTQLRIPSNALYACDYLIGVLNRPRHPNY